MPTRLGIKNYRAIQSRPYEMARWDEFDYSILQYIEVKKKRGKSNGKTYNNIIMMADTETSKKRTDGVPDHNHICAWSLAMRAWEHTIACLWGQDPRDLPRCIEKILEAMGGEETYLYFHNLPYDHVFCRRFMAEAFGKPKRQLNIRPYYPLFVEYSNGLILKDSLILAQRSLEKWASDLGVQTQKAVGSWDYDKIRNQSDKLDTEELHYIENDVVAGVECLNETLNALGCTIGNIPYTATGIPRTEARKISKGFKGYDNFRSQSPDDYALQARYQETFHGGYVHNNRYTAGDIYPAKCMDFASSYPFCALTGSFPSEKFWPLGEEITPEYVVKNSEKWAILFRMRVWGLDLRYLKFPMPPLAQAKTICSHNAIIDNGRILRADYLEIYTNELDAKLYFMLYKWQKIVLDDVYCAWKDPLPKWFTDYVFKCFIKKTKLKGVDRVQYQIEKAKLNAVAYGMMAQKPCQAPLDEDFDTGKYTTPEDFDVLAAYEKHLRNRNNFLPYHWSLYITSLAQYNLFKLGMNCVDYEHGGIWLYSDTDSVYSTKFDQEKIAQYNEECKQKLIARGYGPVVHEGREYWLGVAELDGTYSEFKGLHSKCYAVRDAETGKVKITVAGVPKKGAECLDNDLKNFHVYKKFPGTVTGKLQHKHFFVDEIYTDENGNVTGDSIDLSPCDYIIEDENVPSIDIITEEEVLIQYYEETQ